MATIWSLTFKGELMDGFEKEAVIAAFMETFSIPGEEVARIFSGELHTLAENMSQIDAQYHLSQFNRIGMYVYIQAMPEYDKTEPVRSGRLVIGADGRVARSAPKLQMLKTPYAPDGDGEVKSKRKRRKAPIPPYFNLSLVGRYGRLNFCNAMLLYLLVPIIGVVYLIICEKESMAMLAATVAVTAVSVIPVSRAVLLRLHDLEHSAIWTFVYVLLYVMQFTVFFYYVLYPEAVGQQIIVTAGYISMLFYSVLLFIPGSGGKNTYGFETKQGMPTGAVTLIGLTSLGVYLYPYW